MTKQTLKLEDFEKEKLSKNQKMTIHGGDEPIDPGKGNGKGSTEIEEENLINQNHF